MVGDILAGAKADHQISRFQSPNAVIAAPSDRTAPISVCPDRLTGRPPLLPGGMTAPDVWDRSTGDPLIPRSVDKPEPGHPGAGAILAVPDDP